MTSTNDDKKTIDELSDYLIRVGHAYSERSRLLIRQVIDIAKKAVQMEDAKVQPAEAVLSVKDVIPVRLWVTHRIVEGGDGDWPVRCSAGKPELHDWREIVISPDGKGFVALKAATLD